MWLLLAACDAGPPGPGAGAVPDANALAGDGAPRGSGSDAACPWGASLAADPGVGLAGVPHAAAPTTDEQAVFDAMNARRTGAPLAWNACLADLARGHSVDMMTSGYFGHGSAGDPQTFMIVDRVAATHLTLGGHADEDVLTGDVRYYLGSDIRTVVADWMTDGHAIPILNCAEAGVGISSMPYMDTTIVWVTADFACP